MEDKYWDPELTRSVLLRMEAYKSHPNPELGKEQAREITEQNPAVSSAVPVCLWQGRQHFLITCAECGRVLFRSYYQALAHSHTEEDCSYTEISREIKRAIS